ncbi:acyl-CoA dehydrogenase [Sediminibacterium sp.]|uniref:acyl-CoA dehydrogenase n=1 Tax=Sediminibacterium sp. TaxID=1917865 RepID=UPI003F6E975A
MANYTNMELLKFLLFEVHPMNSLFNYERFAHLNEEQAWMMIESAKLLADQEMAPFFREMDETPVKYDGKGNVQTHPALKKIISAAAEQGWIGGSALFEHGGMQLPEMIFGTAHHLFQAANNSIQGYLGLSTGAAGLITSFGSIDQLEKFVPKIYSGEWQGTMALTEPQAGSSLTDITTSARLINNNEYSIRGQKIFISGGQHEACSNFIHLTLARIEGAPAGIKGISLFIIPKFRPAADGSLEYNDVYCAGDFQKMGQRGYATTHLSFGDNNNCIGYLVGEPNKGLSYMFQMMNGARISVGLCAASVAMAAFQCSLQYCKERPQGRLPSEKDPTKPPVNIIQHADIQRMLLTQKAIAEGSIALGIECNKLYDLSHACNKEERANYLLLLEILTPIIKAYPSEQGSRSAALAIQTLGGYGFTTDFPVQQHYRDLKIMSLYEGTTGIQAIDLLGRKVLMENGKALQLLADEINKTISAANSYNELKSEAEILNNELSRIAWILKHYTPYALEGNMEKYLADATVFLEMMSYTVIGWQWLKMALKASEKLKMTGMAPNQKSFYEGKIHTCQFFFKYEMPHASACATTLLTDSTLTSVSNFELFD